MASMSIQDYKILKTIGCGTYSHVFAVQRENNIYVLKAAYKDKSRIKKFGVTEKNVLMKIKHPFVIKMFCCFTTVNRLCYLLEYAAGGDLKHYVDAMKGKLQEESVVFYAAEISQAIGFLHSKGVVHRDIKLKNILIANDGHIKLTDFGSAAELSLERRTRSFTGTVLYMAPEVKRCDFYSYEVDWWSFGICLYIMLYGNSPYHDEKPLLFKLSLQSGMKRKEIAFPDTISPAAVSLLKGLLTKNPNDRLGKEGVDDIRSHAFFTSVDWEKIEAKEMKPPFVPPLENQTNFCYFDQDFLLEPNSLTGGGSIPEDLQSTSAKSNEHGNKFRGFDYINRDI